MLPGASNISLKLTKGYPNVIMIVEDDCREFIPEDGRTRGRGLGIISMREMIANVKGRFKMHSAPGKGTRVRVEIPLEVNNERP